MCDVETCDVFYSDAMNVCWWC